MAASMVHMDSQSNKVQFSILSGGSLVSVRPVFSLDSKWLFCCSGSVVKVYSTASGECVRVLMGHKNTVTGITINPKNKFQLASCSLDQTVIIWDYDDGVLLRKVHMAGALFGLYFLHDSSLLFCLKQTSESDVCHLVSQSVFVRNVGKSSKVILNDCTNDHRQTSVGCEGRYAVTVKGKKMTMKALQNHGNKTMYTRHFLRKEDKMEEFTCVLCHPVDSMVATGCTNGKIYLWYNIFDEKKVVKTCSHWHSLPVADLSFTREGSYMFSGGKECVLVKWQQNSSNKDFLPRLGAPINHVACSHDNSFYATSLDDNAILLITNTFKIHQVYQGLTRSSLMRTALKNLQISTQDVIPVGLLCDPRSRSLVTNGKPGHLQFFNVAEDKHLYNLDIVSQNYVSSENLKDTLTVTEVIQAAFSRRGTWLATVEFWDDRVMSPELRLKFWKYVEESQTYELNTSVDMPHDDRVVSLHFRPSPNTVTSDPENMAVTSSPDGKFKIWLLVDDTDIYRANQRWTCESVGYYRNFPAGGTSFSDDGSLLAVSFCSTITLWEPDTNILKQTLTDNQIDRGNISFLEFGHHSCSHYLVSCDDHQMTVWNLMSCTVQWSVDMKTSVLTADPLSDVMVVITTDGSAFVFRPSNPQPIFSQSAVSKTQIISGVFIPNSQTTPPGDKSPLGWQKHSQLYLMNTTQKLLTPTLLEKRNKNKETEKVILEQNLPQTTLSVLMSQHRKSGVKPTENTELPQKPKGALKQLLSSAAHVQPPISSLCQPFVGSLLLRKKNWSNKGEEEEEEEDILPWKPDRDSDSDMEVEGGSEDIITSEKQSSKMPGTQSKKEEADVSSETQTMSSSSKQVQVAFQTPLDWYSSILQP